jgi:hypothetical protein
MYVYTVHTGIEKNTTNVTSAQQYNTLTRVYDTMKTTQTTFKCTYHMRRAPAIYRLGRLY